MIIKLQCYDKWVRPVWTSNDLLSCYPPHHSLGPAGRIHPVACVRSRQLAQLKYCLLISNPNINLGLQ